MSEPAFASVRQQFRDVHAEGQAMFVLPNPWDVGSALVLQHMGFAALATTSAGFAATMGRRDQRVSRDELLEHVRALSTAITVPLNVDAERCYGVDPAGVAETVELLAAAGASGLSIEDYDVGSGALDSLDVAVERVGAAAEVCNRHGMVLTGRAENYLYGVTDLDDTITRLRAYRDAGAGAVYAPGLSNLDDIARVVREVRVPLNVLAMRTTPSVAELAGVGVRRVSTGGSLAWAAYGGLVDAANELLGSGTSTFLDRAVSKDIRSGSFTM
jgi:2-methylisocitrate lyase-like PEP mutase family enzyme